MCYKIRELIKELEKKVKDCHNTNTIFDTRKYVLLEDVKELLSSIGGQIGGQDTQNETKFPIIRQ